MSELQAGMLALVVGAKHCHENIGKIVTIESFHNKGDTYKEKGSFLDDLYRCTGDGLVVAMVRHVSGEVVKERGNFAFCARQDLMPIKPEADPLDVTHKEELHA